MKNLSIITILVMFFSLSAVASNYPESAMLSVMNVEKSIVLNLTEQNANTLTVTDEQGTIIFEDNIAGKHSKIQYSLENLPYDNYTIQVKGNDFVNVYQANISKNGIVLADAKQYTRPTISAVANKVIVDAAISNKENLQFTLFDETGRQVYVYSEDQSTDFKRAFNLSKLASGRYQAIVSTDHFINTVEIAL